MPDDIISLTEFKNDASGWIACLQSQPPVVLTQNGRGRAVVLSYDAFRAMQAVDRVGSTPHDKVRNPETPMSTATLTSKGQITIPADVRRELNVEAGDRVEFVRVEPGRYEVVAATRSVRELKGMFGKAARRVSVDEMNQAIAKRGASAR